MKQGAKTFSQKLTMFFQQIQDSAGCGRHKPFAQISSNQTAHIQICDPISR